MIRPYCVSLATGSRHSMPWSTTWAIHAKSSPACVNLKPCWQVKTWPSQPHNLFMAKKIRIPTPLRKLTNNEEVVEVDAATIGAAIVELQSRFPGIKERLIDDSG